jgi:uncharacterized protein
MKILCISDKVSNIIYSKNIVKRFSDIDLILSCGDLPFNYYDFIMSTLNKPLYYVMGNHEPGKYSKERSLFDKYKVKDLTGKIINFNGLIIGGCSGGKNEKTIEDWNSTEFGQSLNIYRIKWNLFKKQLFKKKKIDIFVSHSPAFSLNDATSENDSYHHGFKTYKNFIDKFSPTYHIHGHLHIYDKNKKRILQYRNTTIINVYEYYILNI